MESLFLPVFIFNTFLVLLDAALGYFSAPRLLARSGEPEAGAVGVASVRRLLPFMVGLYMYFNCLGYFQARSTMLLSVTGLLCLDLGLQLFLRNRRSAEGEEE